MEGNIVQQATRKLHEAIVEDLKAGLSYTQISFKHRISTTTVVKHAQRAGLMKSQRAQDQPAEGRTA